MVAYQGQLTVLSAAPAPYRNGQVAPAPPSGPDPPPVDGCGLPRVVQQFLRQPPPAPVPSLKTRVLMTLGAQDGQTHAALIRTLAPQVPEEVAAVLEGNNPRRQLVKMALAELERADQIRRDGPNEEHTVWLVPPAPDSRFELHPILSKELPPVPADVDWGLEWQLVTEGCHDRLWTWTHEGRTFLVDGHRRSLKCLRHGLPYDLRDIGPLSLAEVKSWMWDNNWVRRNYTLMAQRYAVGQRYNVQKLGRGGDRRSDTARKQCLDQPLSDALAASYHVDERTVRRNARFVDSLDRITEVCGPEFRIGLLSGLVPAGVGVVMKMAKLDAEPMRQEVADWLEGRKPAPPAPREPRLVLRGKTTAERIESFLEQMDTDEATRFYRGLGLLLSRKKMPTSA